MPMPKHSEPLVKKSVVVTERQWDALEEKSERVDRPVSYLVREALDDYLAPEPSGDAPVAIPAPEAATA